MNTEVLMPTVTIRSYPRAATRFFARLLALLMLVTLPLAQGGAFAQTRPAYTQAELDRMLAPIALYPDALLSQILMASTYPIEVVEAARWSRANPGLQGDDAVRAVEDKDWDPSVKSLVAFPNVLTRMDENLEWTRQLGDAFLEQEPHVMDTVQRLRQRARAAGTLVPDERIRVVEDGRNIVIVPANPSVIYVPYYDPWVAYGPWWWPAYPPVVWAPWPGYVPYAPYRRPGVGVGFYWGPAINISIGFFFGGVDWYARNVRVVHVHNYYYRPAVVRRDVHVHGPAVVAPGRWQHDPWHRRGVAYRTPDVRQRVAPAAPPRDVRRDEPRQPQRAEQRRPDIAPPPAAPRAAPPSPTAPRSAQPSPAAPRTVPPSAGVPRAAPPSSEGPRAAPPSPEAPRAAPPSAATPRAAPPSSEAPRAAPPPPATPRAVPPSPEAPRAATPSPAAPRAAPPSAATPRAAPLSSEAPRAAPPLPTTPRAAPPAPAAPRAALPPATPRAAPPPPGAPRAAPPLPESSRAAPPSPAVREQPRREAGGAPPQRAQPQQRENRGEQPRQQTRDERP
jgi:hypothetical protein